MRAIRERVIQECRRCAAEVKTSLNGQPNALSRSPASISLLRRACQMRGLRRCDPRRSRTKSPSESRATPAGASEPNQPALARPTRRGATMRFVAVTPE